MTTLEHCGYRCRLGGLGMALALWVKSGAMRRLVRLSGHDGVDMASVGSGGVAAPRALSLGVGGPGPEGTEKGFKGF